MASTRVVSFLPASSVVRIHQRSSGPGGVSCLAVAPRRGPLAPASSPPTSGLDGAMACVLASGLALGALGARRGRIEGRKRRQACMSKALGDAFQCFLLDCDGVLWRGSEAIAGSAKAVRAAKAAGARVVFVTNASISRAELSERLSLALEITVAQEDVVTSGSVVAREAAASGASTVLVLGGPGLREELRLAGVEALAAPTLQRGDGGFDENALRCFVREAPDVGAVVVGHDEGFSYGTLAAASALLQRGGEACRLLGTNPDVGDRDQSGYLVPEAGAIIAAVEAATGRKATITGKPSPTLIRQVLKHYGLAPSEVLMVGDRLDTDIRFGLNGGVQTCLVLTGVSTQEEADALSAEYKPHHVRADLHAVIFGEQGGGA